MDGAIFGTLCLIWVALLWFHPWLAAGILGLSLLLCALLVGSVVVSSALAYGRIKDVQRARERNDSVFLVSEAAPDEENIRCGKARRFLKGQS
jgi:hypothetical protein